MSLEEFDRALGLHTAVEVRVLWALPSQADFWELSLNDFLVPHKSTQRHCKSCAGHEKSLPDLAQAIWRRAGNLICTLCAGCSEAICPHRVGKIRF